MRKQKLTDRQAEYLDYIKGFIKKYIYSPSYTEIAEFFDSRVATVQQFIEILERKGYIRRVKRRHRSIEILK